MSTDHTKRRSLRRDRGAVAVEFGLLLPLLLLIVLGLIDFGMMLNAKVTVTQAAREGARVEATDGDVDARTTAAADPLTISTTVVSSCPGTDAEVRVTHNFTFITPVGAIGAMFGGGDYGDPVEISATGVIPCET